MKKKLVLGFLIILTVACNTQRSDYDQDSIIRSNNNSILDWQDQKFSMFIHWGIYSIPAGVWNGERIGDYAEQIKGVAEIPTEEYRKLTKEFNPTLWNPDSIALLANEAGMKSIVITAKHHDGFSMFDTKYSEFDVVDATPYGKDVIKDLSEACKRHGLNFGVYFSTIDWDYHGALPFTSTENSDSIPPAHHEYNLNQVEELLTNYGDISEIWFDMGAPTYQQSKEIRDLVKRIQPNCAVSGRIWNDQGDFVVMGDNYLPDFKMGVPWQTPASIYEETWGYRSWLERTDLNKKIKEKIHDLIKIVSSGGNYLLNIGPKGDGSVVPYEKNVLQGIGQWLKINGEAIYRTNETELEKPEWGYITANNTKLYLHIIDFPEDNKLWIEGLKATIKKAYSLSDVGISLKTFSKDLGLEIDLNSKLKKDQYAPVVVLEYEDLIYTPSNMVVPDEDDKYILSNDNNIKYHSYSGNDYYSYQPVVVKMKWHLSGNTKEVCEIDIVYNTEITSPLILSINNKEYLIPIQNSKNISKRHFTQHTITNVKLYSDQINEVELFLEDKSNPNKGLSIENIKIEFK